MNSENHILLNTRYLNYYIVGKKELDNSRFIGTIFMDLSKAYGCLPHDLIISKFEAYGLSKNSLTLLLNYLEERKQRVKKGYSCSF